MMEPEKEIKYTKKDFILLTALVLVYSIIALINLGSFKAPQTFWQPAGKGESFYVDLGKVKKIQRIYYWGRVNGNRAGSYRIEYSKDSKEWQPALSITLRYNDVFKWKYKYLNFPARYIKVSVENPDAILHEIGFFASTTGNKKEPVRIAGITPVHISPLSKGSIGNLFDEQDTISYTPGYFNSMYFDEVFHARTAYELIHKIEPFETDHPLLGKILIAIGILIFGMCPFGWRITGTLFGIGMIPLMYTFGKRMFKKTEYAFMCAFLMAFDFMHFTQTRIATLDVYVVFFIIVMYYYIFKYFSMDLHKEQLSKTLLPLFFSGLYFGLGAAVKWNAIFAGAGLAVIFFFKLYESYKAYKSDILTKNTVKTLAACIGFFVVIPVFVYYLSWTPFMMVPGPGHKTMDVIKHQECMYDYHAHLKATHPYTSKWWEWPLMRRPIAYFYGIDSDLPFGKKSSISAFGNPAVWWAGILAAIAALAIGIYKRDRLVFFLFTAYMAQYLPWILVPRIAYIYHYFTCLPFVILIIVYVIRFVKERYPRTGYLVYGYLACVFVLFFMFYPVISGKVISSRYVVNYLHWLKTWRF